jgi:hypothetical protein
VKCQSVYNVKGCSLGAIEAILSIFFRVQLINEQFQESRPEKNSQGEKPARLAFKAGPARKETGSPN